MSTIAFVCDAESKDTIKAGVWEILRAHYLRTVFPNTKVKYEKEGKEVYLSRLDSIKDSLCSFTDTDDGVTVEFDVTEDAGFAIVNGVYHTSMGYSDEGLTYVDPIFKEVVKRFPEVCFEADVECDDGYSCFDLHFSYDGKTLTSDGDEGFEE